MRSAGREFSCRVGRVAKGTIAYPLTWRTSELPHPGGRRMLAYGMGQNYGDSCLLDGGWMIETRELNHLMSLDQGGGMLRCEAGCTIGELLEVCVPRGWFVPVTPGTKNVTVGGAIANDVHGKNHHRAGTFGCFVTRLGLRRSDGSDLECSPTSNPDLFAASIGGLGLTGVITWAELRLKEIHNVSIDQTIVPLSGLSAFFEVAGHYEKDFEYTVAWLDTTHPRALRGILLAGNHSSHSAQSRSDLHKPPRWTVPFVLPDFVLGPLAVRLLNSTYHSVSHFRRGTSQVHYDPFFYPLDCVAHWNRAYGRKGLVQYQFVMPLEFGPAAIEESLAKIHAAGQSSFLTVVKLFGSIASPGLLSFPRPGVTICFDFPYLGAETERLLDGLDAIVFGGGGALYPAKDTRMGKAQFERSYPKHVEFRRFVDPAFASNFSRRVGLTS